MNNQKILNYCEELVTFYVFNLLIIALCFNIHAVFNIIGLIGAICLSSLVICCNHVLNSNYKYIIIFGKINNYFPGSVAFTEKLNEDFRINKQVLKEKHGKFPTDPKEQNEKWYEIYYKLSDNARIFKANRRFLIARDVNFASLLFLFFLLVVYVILILINYKLNNLNVSFLFIILLFEFFISKIAAKNLANNLVKTVLVVESQEIIKK